MLERDKMPVSFRMAEYSAPRGRLLADVKPTSVEESAKKKKKEGAERETKMKGKARKHYDSE